MKPVAERYLRTLEANALEQPSSPTRPTPGKLSDSPAKAASPVRSANGIVSPSKAQWPPATGSPQTPTKAASPARSKLAAATGSPSRVQPGSPSKLASPSKLSSPAKLGSPARFASPAKTNKAIPNADKFTEELPGTGRKKLQHNTAATDSVSWDKERKNLQAYEYLCHVGEAKEWMESIIGEELPDVVEMPDSLQNGVALAKVAKHFRPDLVRKIFEHPKLHYRHIDNIAAFIKFIEDVGMPDLFSFDLVDVYEKRNIPKVVYCLHVLSHMLADDDLAPQMGDLVGKLDFTDDQLSSTQKGLDAIGGSMPNFNKMQNGSKNALPSPKRSPQRAPIKVVREPTPEPEPEVEPEVEEEPEHEPEPEPVPEPVRKAPRELSPEPVRANVREPSLSPVPRQRISSLELRLSGMAAYLRPEELMLMELEDAEDEIIMLQAVCRGHLLRDNTNSRRRTLETMDPAITRLQSAFRSLNLRRSMTKAADNVKLQNDTEKLNSIFAVARGNFVRSSIASLKGRVQSHEDSIRELQSIARSHLLRKGVNTVSSATPEDQLASLQAMARGLILRKQLRNLDDQLHRNESQIMLLQQAIRGASARRSIVARKDHLTVNSKSLIELQSVLRGVSTRQRLSGQKGNLDIALKSVIAVQSAFRGLYGRFKLGCLYDDLDQEILGIVGFQARARGALIRKNTNKTRDNWTTHESQIIKLQSIWRAKRQGDAYKSLIADPNPSLATIKKFVHLINDTDADYHEEVALETARKAVADQVRSNERLEKYIDQLDTKIALLMKNKISLDEVIQHRNDSSMILRHNSGSLSASQSSTDSAHTLGVKSFDLKALNKSSRDRLELYQGLFYIVQTQPQYFARLMHSINQDSLSDRETKNITGLVLKVYGDVQAPREEYFFLQLLACGFKEEMRNIRSLKEFWRSNYLVNRLFGVLNRRKPSCKSLKTILKAPLQKLVATRGMDLESDPLVIYRNLIAAEERSGGTSNRELDVPVDVAIQDSETRAKFVQNLQVLRELTLAIIDSVEQNINEIPYYVRYIAHEAYNFGIKMFGAGSESVLAIVSHIVFRLYISPALTAADNYGIADSALDMYQTKSLGLVAKVLNQTAQLRPFGSDEPYLQPLNEFVEASSERLANLFREIVEIKDLQTEYHMSNLDDVTSRQRPTLTIKTADILGIHSLIFQNLDSIVESGDSLLRPVIKKLGPLPNDAREILDIARFTQVRLDLNPSYGTPIIEGNALDSTGLLTITKRCLVYVLRVQNGVDLMDVLVAPVEHEDEYEYARVLIMHKEISNELSKLTFRELKLLTLEKVLELESTGRITRENDYQELLNSLASDIRNKHHRREARERELTTNNEMLVSLKEKETYLKGLQSTYNNYIEQAMCTLQEQSQQKQKKVKAFPFSRKFFQQRDLLKYGKNAKFGSYRYSADKAIEKGILVHVKGYTERQYRDVAVTFSCDEVSKFNLEVAYKGIILPGASTTLTLDDMLAKQYNDEMYINLFDDVVRFNTDRLLQFIFRKFYGATE